ncbi:hypothetical protein Q1695_001811 [Nippostrongylus brasiliensis]|nr:hypothetical protein Q1695_001811 [Nippostrongylus brasiliensis]
MPCPEPSFLGPMHVVVTIDVLLLCLFSFALQLIMIKVTHKFSGWQSDYSFSLLRLISVFGVIFFASEFVAHVRFAMYVTVATIDRVIGAIFLASFFVVTVAQLSLVTHRVIYTVVPFKVGRFLTPTVLKVHYALIVLVYVALIAVMCTPLAGVAFCPDSLRRFYIDVPGSMVIRWINKVFNYLVGVSTLSAYAIVIGVLVARGNIRMRSNAEMRMMMQVAVMSTVGVFYLVYWECRRFLPLSEMSGAVLYENLTLFYYNALILPYIFLNTTFREEFCRTFWWNRNKSSVKCVVMDSSQQRVTPTQRVVPK